ncbi:hypothetical protein [Cellulomonas iranensis]|uniref:hypothetical protein n=1 Tax=Cellulomonas iranensis TaxID=76862 RepID=UPI000B3C5D65|nr:hypothetical protein [Cellulomonas iranensis]
MLLASATRGGQVTVAQAAMIRQFLRLTQAVYEAASAGQPARHTQLLTQDTPARLMRVRDALPTPALRNKIGVGHGRESVPGWIRPATPASRPAQPRRGAT